MTDDAQAKAQLYRDIFEIDTRGAAIMEDLIRHFARGPVTRGGIDAVLQTYEHGGMRKVIDYIALQINRANGVQDTEGSENAE